MATIVIDDEAGTVNSPPAGSQQISVGRLSWDTCTPASLWERTTTWQTGELSSTIATQYTHQDWLFTASIEVIWYNVSGETRRELREFLWRNGATVTDTVTVNNSSATLADSCVESVALTRSTYTFTPVQTGNTFTPPTATFQRPETITTAFKQSWFDQTNVSFTDVRFVVTYAVSNVYRGTRSFGGIDIASNGGDVGQVAWNIWRSHDSDPYGLVWEDCSGGGGGSGSGEDCPCDWTLVTTDDTATWTATSTNCGSWTAAMPPDTTWTKTPCH